MLVREYQQRIYGLTYHILGDFGDAEDLTQEAFLMAYRKLHLLKQPKKFASWLCSIATNLCRTWKRSAKHIWVSLEMIIEEDQPVRVTKLNLPRAEEPIEELERQELQESVWRALDSLPERCRLTAIIFFMDDMSYKDISDFLSIPVDYPDAVIYREVTRFKVHAD